MCRALEVHLLAALYVPSCANISTLVASFSSWSNSYIHHMVLTSFLSTWYEHWRKKWFLSASTKGIPFWSQPPWLETSDEVWQVGNVENHRKVEVPRWVLGPLCSAWVFFFLWKFLVNFRILWTQKKVTHFRDLQMVAFSVWISWGKKQLNDTLME